MTRVAGEKGGRERGGQAGRGSALPIGERTVAAAASHGMAAAPAGSVKLPANGSYRVFADFTTGGERRTLGIDLVGYDGPRLAADRISKYDAALRRDGDRVEFDVRLGGNPVQLQRYLGAAGHLVVLREGDLAYVHGHADEAQLAFDVPLPSSGRYRLYLQFQVGGKVETVLFGVRQ